MNEEPPEEFIYERNRFGIWIKVPSLKTVVRRIDKGHIPPQPLGKLVLSIVGILLLLLLTALTLRGF